MPDKTPQNRNQLIELIARELVSLQPVGRDWDLLSVSEKQKYMLIATAILNRLHHVGLCVDTARDDAVSAR